MDQEKVEKLNPGYKGLLAESKEQTELLKELVTAQQESNEVAFQHFLLAKCYKERTKKHRSMSFYVAIGAVVIAAAVEVLSNGEVKLLTAVFNQIKSWFI